jgi:hypothetical protein
MATGSGLKVIIAVCAAAGRGAKMAIRSAAVAVITSKERRGRNWYKKV